jgi:hypothetical protein
MTFNEWAARWGLPDAAVTELVHLLAPAMLVPVKGTSEEAVKSAVRLEAARTGTYLWRNNVGAGELIGEDGQRSFVRWGLANDSTGVNKVIKSADLIGIRPHLVTQADVGRTIGQFVSREVKAAGWKYRGTEREQAQLRWAALISKNGGDAAIVNGTGSL